MIPVGTMARCPYCMAVNPASASICYSCGRVILGAGGMAMRIEPNLPGGHMVHGVRKGPPPGLNVRRGGKRNKNAIATTIIMLRRLLFFFFARRFPPLRTLSPGGGPFRTP